MTHWITVAARRLLGGARALTLVLPLVAVAIPAGHAQDSTGADTTAPATPRSSADSEAATPATGETAAPAATGTAAAAPARTPSGSSLMDPRSPLAPAPTRSPRQTLESFRILAGAAEKGLIAAYYEADTQNTFFDPPAVRAMKRSALNDIRRAMTTMDLSKIAPTNRRTVGINAVLLLQEILDRVPLPDPGDIPDVEEVLEDGAAPRGWTLPGTNIQMLRSEDLSGEPRYLFSADTVDQLPQFYERVRDLPRRTPGQIDFYQHFVSAPGLSMPVVLYRFVLDLPPWTMTIYYEQAVWQWIALGVLTAVFAGVLALMLRGAARFARSGSESVGSAVRRLVVPVFIIALLALYRYLCDNVINFTGDVLAYIELIVESLQTLVLAVLVLFGFNLVAALIIASPQIRKESLDASLIRLVLRVIGFVAAAFIIFFGATRIGLPVYGIVAGLGVGGLAIALAVRPTLENFIGGIILYADRPVKVGDFCQFGSMLGTVEEIGLRSTKVRSLNRTLVTVQNSEFSQMSITNFSRRDANLMQTLVRLRHETGPERLTAITEAIGERLRNDPRVKAETVRVVLLDIAPSALDVEIWAYIDTADYTTFLKIKEELLKAIMAIVEEHGSAFAMPAQTTYLARDAVAAPPALAMEEHTLEGFAAASAAKG